MIYLDTSVALAQLLAEDVMPPDWIWQEPLVSSRLFEYELWTRINGRGLAATHGDAVRALIGRVGLLELIPEIVASAYTSFPAPVRTLDALHLASLEFLRAQRVNIRLASYDKQMLKAARKLKIVLALQ